MAFFLELPLHGQKQLCLSVSTGVSELPLDSIDQRSASIHAVFLGFTTRSLEHVWKKRGRKDGADAMHHFVSFFVHCVAPRITSAFARSDLGLLGFPRVLAKDDYAEAALATCKHLRICASISIISFHPVPKDVGLRHTTKTRYLASSELAHALLSEDVYWHDCFGSLR